MIMGEETPDNGTFKVGETVKIGYVDQSHKDLLDDKTIFEVLRYIKTKKMPKTGIRPAVLKDTPQDNRQY